MLITSSSPNFLKALFHNSFVLPVFAAMTCELPVVGTASQPVHILAETSFLLTCDNGLVLETGNTSASIECSARGVLSTYPNMCNGR
jgi:hypothetical protein